MKEGRSDEPAQQRSDVRGVRPAHDANALFFAKALFALVCIKNDPFWYIAISRLLAHVAFSPLDEEPCPLLLLNEPFRQPALWRRVIYRCLELQSYLQL